MKGRYQASGRRHQGSGYEARVALAVTGSSGEARVADPSAMANGVEYLKPDTCGLKPSGKRHA